MTLGKHERLIRVGNAPLRAPNGKPLPAVPQYMIVPANEADPASVATLDKNEWLIMAGTVHSRTSPDDVKTLYVKEAAENVNKKSGLSKVEEKACNAILSDLLKAFAEIRTQGVQA